MSETVVLCGIDEVAEGEIKKASLPDGSHVALYRVDGMIYATADMCTHGEASLSEEGILTGKIVECTFHFGTFDVTTGEPTGMPGTARPLPAGFSASSRFTASAGTWPSIM